MKNVDQIPDEIIADSIAAENVRLLLSGVIIGQPLEGTLAHRVYEHIEMIKDTEAEKASGWL
jgi:hypothetical protein